MSKDRALQAQMVAALMDFLRENEPSVMSPGGRYMRWEDGRPVVVDVILARQQLAVLLATPSA